MSENSSKTPRSGDNRRKQVVLNVILAVLITAFVVSAVVLISYFANAKAEQDKYDEDPNISALESIFNGYQTGANTPNDTTTVVPSDTTTPSDTSETVSPDVGGTTVPSDTTTVTQGGQDTTVPTDTTATTTAPPKPVYSESFKLIRDNIKQLQRINDDIIGFISIPSLGLDYPLLHREEDVTNSFYTKLSFDLSPAVSGSIFMDYLCSRTIAANKNTVIYGHNMKLGDMFGKLLPAYNSEEKFKNADIFVATLDGVYVYKFFSTYTTDAKDDYCRTIFSSDEAFERFYNDLAAKSKFDAGIEGMGLGKILTLSTCNNSLPDGRYAFHAVLVRIET